MFCCLCSSISSAVSRSTPSRTAGTQREAEEKHSAGIRVMSPEVLAPHDPDKLVSGSHSDHTQRRRAGSGRHSTSSDSVTTEDWGGGGRNTKRPLIHPPVTEVVASQDASHSVLTVDTQSCYQLHPLCEPVLVDKAQSARFCPDLQAAAVPAT